jgi:hypothetical protein
LAFSHELMPTLGKHGTVYIFFSGNALERLTDR